MELNIVNPESVEFLEQLGITEERSNELSAKLDAITKANMNKIMRTVDHMNNIAQCTDNINEYTYCLLSHSAYMMIVYGVTFCPIKQKAHADTSDGKDT